MRVYPWEKIGDATEFEDDTIRYQNGGMFYFLMLITVDGRRGSLYYLLD